MARAGSGLGGVTGDDGRGNRGARGSEATGSSLLGDAGARGVGANNVLTRVILRPFDWRRRALLGFGWGCITQGGRAWQRRPHLRPSLPPLPVWPTLSSHRRWLSLLLLHLHLRVIPCKISWLAMIEPSSSPPHPTPYPLRWTLILYLSVTLVRANEQVATPWELEAWSSTLRAWVTLVVT